jgi:hypothetical protein
MNILKLLFMTTISAITSCCNGQISTPGASKAPAVNSKAPTRCDYCGKTYCMKDCPSAQSVTAEAHPSSHKELLPSCSLSESQLRNRKSFLQLKLGKKVKAIQELESGYDFSFITSKKISKELIDFIQFEKGCCSSFTYALIFEPKQNITHLQIYGSPEIKEEISTVFRALGFIR